MKICTPADGWGRLAPRRCQMECLPILISHYEQPSPERGIVRMIMGSGKSVAMAQFAACCKMDDADEVIVVSTSSIGLVEQLEETFKARLGDDFMDNQRVGTYYTHGKDIHTPIIITCLPSMQALSDALTKHGKRCVLWIGDEFHKSEIKSIKEAYQALMPEKVLAFTATPFRASEKERLTMVDKLLYDYGPSEALRDKVVVPWRIVSWNGGECDRDDACIAMTKDSIGTGMFDADSIADAEVFAKKLRDTGWLAEAVHSELSKADHKSRMNAIKNGQLKAVVHVSQLVEGSDIPSLRWLCLRRAVSSRVRFVQHVGRVLRAHPGKEEAVCYDPYGLFDLFHLSPEEVIGGVDLGEEIDAVDEATRLERQLEQKVFAVMRHIVSASTGKEPLSVDPLAGYLRELVNAFDICKLLKDRKIASREWRLNPVSAPQAKAIENMGWTTGRKCVPGIHAKALGILAGKYEKTDKGKYTTKMNRGIASDLLSVLMSLADKKKWPDFKNLDDSATQALDNTKNKHKITVAGGAPTTGGPSEPQANPAAPPPPILVQGELF